MTVQRITASRFAGITGPERIERLETALADQEQALQAARAGSHEETIASRNVADLERLLDRARQNARIGEARRTDLEAARTQHRTAAVDQQQADLEAELRRRYDRAMPKPVTDAEWEMVRDSVMHKHRLKTMNQHDELVAAARRGPYRL